MRHAVLGAGGVGGLVGAVLGHAGHAVTLILPGGRLAAHPDTLTLESALGAASAAVVLSPALTDDVDVLWVTTKATQLDDALAAVAEPARARLVVPLLNGIDHVAKLRARFGAARVVPGTIACESERVAPGRIVHRSPFVRFAFLAADAERLAPVVDLLRAFGGEVALVPDEPTLLWRKLVFLAPVALTTSAGGLTLGEVRDAPAWRARLEGAVREACAVAAASGATVDPDATLRGLAAMPAGLRSSMSKDVAAGREPELDAIAGPILRGGQTYGVEVTVTAELEGLVRGTARA